MSVSTAENYTVLYEKYRPRKLSDLVGSKARENATILQNKLDTKSVPHTILFTGKTGCGKTTTMRILANALTTVPEQDIQEYNISESTGIDFIRGEIAPNYTLTAWGGARIYIFDEIHRMSQQAQDAFLKIAEGVPDHVYFFIATNQPEKLVEAVHSRFQTYHFDRPSDDDLGKFLHNIAQKEGLTITYEDCKTIANKSSNIRKAVNNLEQLIGLPDLTSEKIAALIGSEEEEKSDFWPVLKLLLWERVPSVPDAWKTIAPIINKELSNSGAVPIAARIATTCRNRVLQVKYKDSAELIRCQRLLRLFSRDMANQNGDNILVSTLFEALTIRNQEK